jgi:integrase
VWAFFEISLAAGSRPFELALIRRTDLDFARVGITFRAETTKTGEARTVPLNPHGPYMAWLQSRRFGHGYIFEPPVVGKGRPRRAAPSLKVFARSITDSMRTVWREVLIDAGLADAGLWMRDTRRTCAIHWRRCGVPKDDRQVLLGHAADVHDGYALTDFEGLQSRLQQFVWSRERAVPETAVAR